MESGTTPIVKSTPSSTGRVRRGTPRKSLTPRRRHLATGEDSSAMLHLSGREQLAAALSDARAEIAELQEGLNGGTDGDIVSRLALLADRVTRRRLEQKNAVLSRVERAAHLSARVEQAKLAAVPTLTAAARSRSTTRNTTRRKRSSAFTPTSHRFSRICRRQKSPRKSPTGACADSFGSPRKATSSTSTPTTRTRGDSIPCSNYGGTSTTGGDAL